MSHVRVSDGSTWLQKLCVQDASSCLRVEDDRTASHSSVQLSETTRETTFSKVQNNPRAAQESFREEKRKQSGWFLPSEPLHPARLPHSLRAAACAERLRDEEREKRAAARERGSQREEREG
ncbi:unnamed protein product [Pleuronectes platessa]|uniref:Uncharacterized protein n=1 Tax=Pleuronectes platessa TaxID=8262 RepID=A0A9N7YYY5_PLEPL|nr:unnamed protein product [Pleuronectes platessa]